MRNKETQKIMEILNGKSIVTTIDIRYGGSLLELKQRIDDYVSKGYTKYECEYQIGYYDEVTGVKIEVAK